MISKATLVFVKPRPSFFVLENQRKPCWRDRKKEIWLARVSIGGKTSLSTHLLSASSKKRPNGDRTLSKVATLHASRTCPSLEEPVAVKYCACTQLSFRGTRHKSLERGKTRRLTSAQATWMVNVSVRPRVPEIQNIRKKSQRVRSNRTTIVSFGSLRCVTR